MTDLINEQNLIGELRRTFPELEERYLAEVESWQREPPGHYVVMGVVFRPHFKSELERGVITDFLRRSAVFLERVCASGNTEAINVIWIKIFEWLLLSHPTSLRLIWPVLGPITRATIKDAASRWNSLDALPQE